MVEVSLLVGFDFDNQIFVRLAKSLFQLFKENPLWKLPNEPFIPLDVAYPNVRHGQLWGAKLGRQGTECRMAAAGNVVRHDAVLGASLGIGLAG
jgi:hypothetical protein